MPNNLRSTSLDLLRFPLALVILTIHTFPSTGIVDAIGYEDHSTYTLFSHFCFIINAFFREQSVPIYYFISGYVFFYNVDFCKDVYIKKLHNRLHSLLIPYLVWNAIALAIVFLKGHFAPTVFNGAAEIVSNFTASDFIRAFTWIDLGAVNDQPINGVLWFVRNLIIICLLSPAIYHMVKGKNPVAIIVFGLLWLYMFNGQPLSNYIGKIPREVTMYFNYGLCSTFFYFTMGAFFSANKIDMISAFRRINKLSLVLFFSLILLQIMLYEFANIQSLITFVKSVNIIIGLFFAFNLASYLVEFKHITPNPFLAAGSFFFYVSHGLLIGNILKALIMIIKPSSSLALISTHFLAIIATITIILSTFMVIYKYSPILCQILAGRKRKK